MKAEELDKKFDDGEDVLDLFDLTTLKRPALETQSVSVNIGITSVLTLDRRDFLVMRPKYCDYFKILY
jgi:hypothetical protein